MSHPWSLTSYGVLAGRETERLISEGASDMDHDHTTPFEPLSGGETTVAPQADPLAEFTAKAHDGGYEMGRLAGLGVRARERRDLATRILACQFDVVPQDLIEEAEAILGEAIES